MTTAWQRPEHRSIDKIWPVSPPLESLSFWMYRLDDPGLSQLMRLGATKGLSFDTSDNEDYRYEYPLREIQSSIDAIPQFTADILERLAIELSHFSWKSDDAVLHFCRLHKLKHLHIAADLMFWLFWSSDGDLTQLLPLINVLPPSLESWCTKIGSFTQDARKFRIIMIEIAKRHDHVVPNLQKATCYVESGLGPSSIVSLYNSSKEACEGVGITLTHPDDLAEWYSQGIW